MNKTNALIKNTLIISIGKVCTQCISFFLLPLYTMLLSTEDYGIVDLVVTYVQLLVPIVILQMDQALFRFLVLEREHHEGKKTCISTVFIFLITQVLIVCVIGFFVLYAFDNKYIFYLCITLVVSCMLNMGLQMARGIGDNITYAVASFLCTLVTLILNVLFIVGFRMKAEGMLLAGIFGNAVAFLYIFLKDKIYKYFEIREFDIKTFKGMLKYALPLIPNALIWWIINASDRSIVLFFLGPSTNGILAIAHKIPEIVTIIYNIFHISWTESAALHLKSADRDEFFSNVFDVVYRLFVAMCIGIIAVVPFVFHVINQQYEAAFYQIPIYVLAALFNVVAGLYSVVYISEMKTNEIMKTSLWSGIINIIVHLGLINYIGLYAASISSALSFMVMAIYRAFDIRKYIRQKVNVRVLISSGMAFSVVMVLFYMKSNALNIVSLIIALVYSLWINYNTLHKLAVGVLKKIKKGNE